MALPRGASADTLCGRCLLRPPPWSRAWVPWRYAWPLDRLILGMKFSRRLSWAHALGELLADAQPGTDVDLLVPVPMHPSRLAVRGFNQAQEIASRLAQRQRLPMLIEGCRRSRATAAQSTLCAQARLRNLSGSCRVDARRVAGRRLLIVDDVMTTGATATVLARCLLDAGAVEVMFTAVARA